MSIPLHIDSSPLGDASITRRLSSEFVQNWKQANPAKSLARDLPKTKFTGIDAQWIVQPYLCTIFGFMGVADTNFHSAGRAAAINFGKIDRQNFLQPHIDSIRAQFQSA
jgi:FMN-dependent NADH-azoreductase